MIQSIVSLIVDTAASVLAGALLLRFWMQIVRVRPPASMAHFVFQLTDWLVRPLRRVLPGLAGIDWASLLAAFLVALLATLIQVMLLARVSPETVLFLSVLRLVGWILYGLMGLIIVGAVFSWVNPHAPLAPFVNTLTEPLLTPIRRVVPFFGQLDLSPLIALVLLRIGLHLIDYLIVLLA